MLPYTHSNRGNSSGVTNPKWLRKYIQHVRAVVRLVQKATLHDEAKNLLVGQALVWLLSQRGNLPEDDPKGPMGETKHEWLREGRAESCPIPC